MSHLVTIKVEIIDLTALARACEMIGLKFDPNRTVATGYQNATNVHGVIMHPTDENKYQIGLAQVGDHYELRTDAWVWADPRWMSASLRDQIGDNCKRLLQYYALATAMQTAEQCGHVVTGWSEDAEGEITLEIEDNMTVSAVGYSY